MKNPEMPQDSFEVYIQSADALFHYTKSKTALNHILPKNQLRFSPLHATNDPKENKFLIYNARNLSRVPHKLFLEQKPIVNREMDRILRFHSQVLCFCQNLVNQELQSYGFERSRMWSQYGEGHRGLCLVFSKDAIINELKQQFQSSNIFLRDIDYKDTPRISYRANTLNALQMDTMGSQEYAEHHLRTHSDEFFFSKNIDYRDESELRVLLFNIGKNRRKIALSNILKGIIIGMDFPKDQTNIVEDYCKKFKCQCRQLYWSRWEPNLLHINPTT